MTRENHAQAAHYAAMTGVAVDVVDGPTGPVMVRKRRRPLTAKVRRGLSVVLETVGNQQQPGYLDGPDVEAALRWLAQFAAEPRA